MLNRRYIVTFVGFDGNAHEEGAFQTFLEGEREDSCIVR